MEVSLARPSRGQRLARSQAAHPAPGQGQSTLGRTQRHCAQVWMANLCPLDEEAPAPMPIACPRWARSRECTISPSPSTQNRTPTAPDDELAKDKAWPGSPQRLALMKTGAANQPTAAWTVSPLPLIHRRGQHDPYLRSGLGSGAADEEVVGGENRSQRCCRRFPSIRLARQRSNLLIRGRHKGWSYNSRFHCRCHPRGTGRPRRQPELVSHCSRRRAKRWV